MYGGDELGAIVIDAGQNSFRVGYAQDDAPKIEIPSAIGVLDDHNHGISVEASTSDGDGDAAASFKSSKKYYIDSGQICVPRVGMEITSFMRDCMIEDWDMFEKVLEYTYDKCIRSKSEMHPVLISEAPWNVRSKRERLTELMFEKFKVPAFFLVKNAALAAFANGRATAIVVDSGATHTSAIPVQDGLVLGHAIARSPIGGDYMTLQCKNLLKELGVDIVPPYLIAGKEVVKEKEKPRWTRRHNVPAVTASWHEYMAKRVLQDFQSSVLQVSEQAYDEKSVSTIPMVHYEFPEGYHQDFGSERFLIPEALFDPSVVQLKGGTAANTMLGIGHIVTTSVSMCDSDVRSSLYNNVVVTGGNSLIQGFPERLNKDLAARIPSSMRLKIISSSGTSERRFGSWIGGSILASVGTFMQMWISSQEYEEGGKNQVERKCP